MHPTWHCSMQWHKRGMLFWKGKLVPKVWLHMIYSTSFQSPDLFNKQCGNQREKNESCMKTNSNKREKCRVLLSNCKDRAGWERQVIGLKGMTVSWYVGQPAHTFKRSQSCFLSSREENVWFCFWSNEKPESNNKDNLVWSGKWVLELPPKKSEQV